MFIGAGLRRCRAAGLGVTLAYMFVHQMHRKGPTSQLRGKVSVITYLQLRQDGGGGRRRAVQHHLVAAVAEPRHVCRRLRRGLGGDEGGQGNNGRVVKGGGRRQVQAKCGRHAVAQLHGTCECSEHIGMLVMEWKEQIVQ